MFYSNGRPHAERLSRRIEMFNEVMVLLLSYHMLFFTPWFTLKNFYFYIGFTFLGVIGLMLAVNLVFMFRVQAIKYIHVRRREAMLLKTPEGYGYPQVFRPLDDTQLENAKISQVHVYEHFLN